MNDKMSESFQLNVFRLAEHFRVSCRVKQNEDRIEEGDLTDSTAKVIQYLFCDYRSSLKLSFYL